MQKELRFIITGNSFFEKGGIEIFEALRTFRKDINIKLNVVSNFNGCRHLPVHTGFRPEEERNLKRSIADNKEWVTVYKNLPNRQVLKLMQQAHIGLLPSYVDTYGYSVLESQAAGCPVITTDIRALPEMNNQKYGWVCNINDDMRSMGGIKDRKCLNQLREKNRIALIQSVEEILNHPESIEEKGRRSVDRIKREHSPAAYGDKLYQIYCKGVNHG